MTQRSVILLLLAAGTSACGSPGANDADGERLPVQGDETCSATGAFQAPAITELAGPLQGSVPRAVVPKDDGVWFSDSQDVTLSHLAGDGILRRFPAPFPSEAVFDAALGADGNVWFDIVTADLVAHVGRMTPEGEASVFQVPSGARVRRVTRGPDDAIWFTAGEGVGRVTADGLVSEVNVGAMTLDITAGPSDTVWFTEPDANRIGRVTPDGTVTHFDVPSAASSPYAITLGPDDHVWFTQANTGKIGQINEEGAIREVAVVAAPASVRELASGPDGRLWFTLSTGDVHRTQVGSVSTCGDVALVDLPALSDPIDLRPAVVDVPAVPYGIAGGDDEIWVTVRLEPFETGAVLRLDLGSAH